MKGIQRHERTSDLNLSKKRKAKLSAEKLSRKNYRTSQVDNERAVSATPFHLFIYVNNCVDRQGKQN